MIIWLPAAVITCPMWMMSFLATSPFRGLCNRDGEHGRLFSLGSEQRTRVARTVHRCLRPGSASSTFTASGKTRLRRLAASYPSSPARWSSATLPLSLATADSCGAGADRGSPPPQATAELTRSTGLPGFQRGRPAHLRPCRPDEAIHQISALRGCSFRLRSSFNTGMSFRSCVVRRSHSIRSGGCGGLSTRKFAGGAITVSGRSLLSMGSRSRSERRLRSLHRHSIMPKFPQNCVFDITISFALACAATVSVTATQPVTIASSCGKSVSATGSAHFPTWTSAMRRGLSHTVFLRDRVCGTRPRCRHVHLDPATQGFGTHVFLWRVRVHLISFASRHSGSSNSRNAASLAPLVRNTPVRWKREGRQFSFIRRSQIAWRAACLVG